MTASRRNPYSIISALVLSLAVILGLGIVSAEPAHAASPFAGRYTGTANGYETVLEVSADGKVTYFNAWYYYSCGTSPGFGAAYWDTPVQVDTAGGFSKKIDGESISGTIASNGTASVYYKYFYAGCAGDIGVTLKRAGPAPLPVTSRIAGDDRYSTAIAVSKSGYPTTAKVVYVATGSDYPDALAAAPAAAKEGGPLLLTTRGSLPTAVANEIKRLKPTKVVVVGGTGAVSAKTFDQVKKIVTNTVRTSGNDRYATARAIAQAAFATATTAYIATGSDYPDALSASAPAGAAGAPVILVNGKAKSIDKATKDLLTKLKVKKTIIAGGAGVVTEGIQNSLSSFGVTRVAGNDRFSTSQKLNKALAGKANTAYVATGFGFPDALAGAAVAGAKKAPLYVVQRTCIPTSIRTDILNGPVNRVNLLGGTGVLTDGVKKLKSC